MLERLVEWEARYELLNRQLADPEVATDPKRLRALSKEHADVGQVVEIGQRLKSVEASLSGNQELLQTESDPEMIAMIQEELIELKQNQAELSQEFQWMLLPKDPDDEKNVILEVRSGTGGDEAALFAGDLFRMYARYAEKKNWKMEILSSSEGSKGGFKEIISLLEGDQVYSWLKFESGVHRVQRVPDTETQGRIHTSAVTVAVMPEAPEVEVNIAERDIRVDVYRSSGPGGQSVNTTDSAVRITHLATGLVVTCQDEKSQHKNRAKALRILGARLLDKMQAEQAAVTSAQRRDIVKSGDRSEKVRTYNFPQDRLTDHRIGLTVHKLPAVLAGELEPIIVALRSHHQAAVLSQTNAKA